jgi:ribosomal protein S18
MLTFNKSFNTKQYCRICSLIHNHINHIQNYKSLIIINQALISNLIKIQFSNITGQIEHSSNQKLTCVFPQYTRPNTAITQTLNLKT